MVFGAARLTSDRDEWGWLSLIEQGRSGEPLSSFWHTLIGDRGEDGTCPAHNNYRKHFAAYLVLAITLAWLPVDEAARAMFDKMPNVLALMRQGDANLFAMLWNDKINGNAFFVTEDGRMVLGTMTVEYDDHVAIVSGASPVYFLRTGAEHYRFIGDSYVHGLMDSEALSSSGQAFTRNSIL